jgi:hypothetical protein
VDAAMVFTAGIAVLTAPAIFVGGVAWLPQAASRNASSIKVLIKKYFVLILFSFHGS